ncbi:MAG TPA: GNAT family N-acetyltransferase [Microvirga sp.]|jgi:GNAT superfamily N-acetyltransferase|nr:GNAT family N-acetyltransferase [Microvirga sp.]
MRDDASAFDLPDLPPDLRFERLPRTDDAFDFAFAVKRAAMGPHIVARWGWDEDFQRDFHRRRFDEKPFFRIAHRGVSVGTLALTRYPDHILFDDFYLLPAWHRRGIGSAILRHCLARADALNLPVRLRHLQWNPVGALYRRHGFAEVGRTDIHCLLERPPGAGPA